jgi:hypothetical protein
VRVVIAAATSPLVGRVAAAEKVAPAYREAVQEVGLHELERRGRSRSLGSRRRSRSISQGRRRGAQEMALPRLAAALEINFPGWRLCKAKISDKEEQGEFF